MNPKAAFERCLSRAGLCALGGQLKAGQGGVHDEFRGRIRGSGVNRLAETPTKCRLTKPGEDEKGDAHDSASNEGERRSRSTQERVSSFLS